MGVLSRLTMAGSAILREIQECDFSGFRRLFASNECLIELGNESGDERLVSTGRRYVDGVLGSKLSSWEALRSVFNGAAPTNLWVLVQPDGDGAAESVVGSIGVRAQEGKAEEAEVARMYVDSSCRRRGYGRRLMEHLKAHCHSHGIELLRLCTPSANEPGIAFYVSVGFQVDRHFEVD